MPITYLDSAEPKSKITYLDDKQPGEIMSPSTARERKATARGGSFDWLGQIKKEEEANMATGKPSFMGALSRGVQIPLAGISGAYNVGESALSDVALGLTERKPQDIPRHLAETFTGKRTSKFSDVAESVGVPEGLPSAAAGLATSFGLTNLATAGRLGKAAFDIGKKGFDNAISSAKYALKNGKTMQESFKNVRSSPEFAERTRKAFYKVKTDLVDKFGSQLDELSANNPDRIVSLRDTIDDIKLNMDDLSPETKSAFRKIPGLNKLIENPELASRVSLRETQDIINNLNTRIPAQIKFKNLDILDTLNDVRASQLEAFPEMANVRAEYAAGIEPYKNLKNYFKFNKLLGAIEKDFGGQEGLKAVKSILPADTIKEIGGYKKAVNLLRLFKSAGKKVAAGTAIGIGGKLGYELFK